MSTSIYLSNNKIQAVTGSYLGGKLRLDHMYQMDMPEGCFLNGLVIAEDPLKDLIANFWNTYQLPRKGITLTLPSPQFVTRNVNFPPISEKRVLESLPKEFLDAEAKESPVYDFTITAGSLKKGGAEVLAVMTERSLVSSFVELFASAGITLERITINNEAEGRLLRYLPQTQEGNSILLILEGNYTSSVLVVNGQVVYSTYSRIFSDSDSDGWAVELARNTNAILQFYATLHNPEPVQCVYIGGMSLDEQQRFGQATKAMCNLDARSLDETGIEMNDATASIGDYFVPAGSLIGGQKNLNLVSRYRKKPEQEKARRQLFKYCIPPVVTLIICLLATAVLSFVQYGKQTQLDNLNGYINAPAYLEQYESALSLQSQVQELTQKVRAAQEIVTARDTYPLLNSQVVSTIQQCGSNMQRVQIQSYTAENGTILLSAQAAQVTDINVFVSNLKASGLFLSVEYSGYGYSESTQVYNVNVTGYLAGSAGR